MQAVIAAEHARAARAEDTDWEAIARAYDRLVAIDPSPVIALNRAVAVAMAPGPEAGLALADEQAEALDAYHLLHATRADLLRRLGRARRRARPTSARSRSRPCPWSASSFASASPSWSERRAGRGRGASRARHRPVDYSV